MRVLGNDQLTTQEIADRMPDVPKSSLYRHLKLLLDGSLVSLAETRLVNGIQEKVYQLEQLPLLGPEDMADLTADDHVRYFTTYVLTLLQDFAIYAFAAEEAQGAVDMMADTVGYREGRLYATPTELEAAITAINQAVRPLVQNGPGDGRRAYKLATVLHPLVNE